MPLLADNLRALHAMMVVLALVIAGLVLGADILIPLAIATILAFILSPLVRRFVRWSVPEGVAVTLVFAGFLLLASGLSAVLSTQLLGLTADLQSYRGNLVEKARWVSELTRGEGMIRRASDAVGNLGSAFQNEFSTGNPVSTPGSAVPSEPDARPAPTGQKESVVSGLMAGLTAPAAKFALTLLFTLFLLLQYQDIRDRVIRIAGTDNLIGTTGALSDAGSRLSKLFLAQAALNAGFGIFIGIALALIGVPNPILWGVVAAIMRFVPFIGSLIAAVPPILLAAGVDPGWGMALATLALFLVGEPLMGHVIEPLILGRSVGLSPFAMVISASFWTLIWGPIGLVLAAPLTMLIVILGRYVPGLEFASVLLGDERALDPPQAMYRRLLSGDARAAIEQVDEAIDASGIVSAGDEVILPSLRLAAADNRSGRLDAARLAEIEATAREVIEYVAEMDATNYVVTSGARHNLLVVPARGRLDELAADAVAATLEKTARVDPDVSRGSYGLSALSQRRSLEDWQDVGAVMLVTAGNIESRLLAIMARRATATFPSARVYVFDTVPSGDVRSDTKFPENATKLASIADARAALDFEPSQKADVSEGRANDGVENVAAFSHMQRAAKAAV